jgi:hypothetical protein
MDEGCHWHAAELLLLLERQVWARAQPEVCIEI